MTEIILLVSWAHSCYTTAGESIWAMDDPGYIGGDPWLSFLV